MTQASAPAPIEHQLRARIGWLCQVVRGAVLVYPLWLAAALAVFWMDDAAIRAVYPAADGEASGAIPPETRLAAMAVAAAIWALVALGCACVWRLFSLYLKGHVFSAEAAAWLHRAGAIGVLALAADVAARPLLAWILAAQAPGGLLGFVRVGPTDLMLGLLFVGVLALAQVFRAAAEIAEEHAQFV